MKKEIFDRIRKQCGEDPSRWRREMEAEWAEDEDVWLPQSLIVKYTGTEKTCGMDLELFSKGVSHHGRFFAGLDSARRRRYWTYRPGE